MKNLRNGNKKIVKKETFNCNYCVFKGMDCIGSNSSLWVNNKELYSSIALDKEIEIEVGDILTKKEKEYLSAVIKPFRERVDCIRKVFGIEYEFIRIELKYSKEKRCEENISLPYFNPGTMYKEMKLEEEYTLKDLDL